MTRLLVGAVGVATGLYGLVLVQAALTPAQLLRLPLWLGGATLADDAVLIPTAVAVGWLLTRRARTDTISTTVIRTTLVLVGITTLIALPLMTRQDDAANPTVLPRDYRADWLRLESLIITIALATLIIRRLRRGPHHGPHRGPHRPE